MYVCTESQFSFIRSDKDMAGFIRNYLRKIEAHFDYLEAPKTFRHFRGDRKEKLTEVRHAETGMTIGLLEGWV